MLRKFLKKAQKQGWAIGQFNFSNLEQLRAITEAAKSCLSPVILGTTEKELSFLGLEETIALVRILEQKLKIPLFLNLDHGKNLDLIKKAVNFGFDSVHFDGSLLSLEENIELMQKVISFAHKEKVLVEGELGCLRGESKLFLGKRPAVEEEDFTKPQEVRKFVSETKADSLAVSVGSIHGVYKGTRGPERIDFERLGEIRSKTNAFLVLHGGSGVMTKDLRKAIACGVTKVNINTDLRVAWRNGLKKALSSPEVKPYLILPEVVTSMEKVVKNYIKVFGSYNRL